MWLMASSAQMISVEGLGVACVLCARRKRMLRAHPKVRTHGVCASVNGGWVTAGKFRQWQATAKDVGKGSLGSAGNDTAIR